MRRTNRKAKRSNGVRTSNSLNREVFCLRMVDNDSRSRLLRLQLKFFAQRHVDARRIKQREKLLLILESRAGGITKTVTRALVFLSKQSRQLRRIRTGNPQLFANTFVPQLSQCLRTLNAQTVEV